MLSYRSACILTEQEGQCLELQSDVNQVWGCVHNKLAVHFMMQLVGMCYHCWTAWDKS